VVFPSVPPPAPAAARDPGSGVIEGFSGVPWSWRARERMVATLARVGLGFYLYAPKDDPLHRDRWRDPYPRAFVDRFGRLAQDAAAGGVTLVFGISPFIDYDASTEADYEALRAKLGALAAAGVRGFAVLADDIELESTPVVDGALGAVHAGVTNRLLADLEATYPGVTFAFVPTVYSDERIGFWPGGADYLRALRALDARIPVMWTGPLTGNATLQPAELQGFVDLVGRPPLIWDNYYANDGGDGFTGHLPLGAYEGRDPGLPAAVAGLAVNASIQGALARLEVGMFGCYRGAPAACDAAAQRAAAVDGELGAGGAAPDRAALARLLEVFDGRASEAPRFLELEAALDRVTADLQASGGASAGGGAGALLGRFAEMATLASLVHHGGLDADLVDELAFPLERVRADGELGLWTMALLAERLAGLDGGEVRARAEEAKARADACRFVLSPGRVADLHQLVVALPARDTGLGAPSTATPAPPRCRAGRELEWTVFGGAAALRAHGLPGATVDAARGAVRFTPPHAGTYRAVVAAEGAAGGWGFVLADLVCGG
jgi:hyaluronoglucosaminidase